MDKTCFVDLLDKYPEINEFSIRRDPFGSGMYIIHLRGILLGTDEVGQAFMFDKNHPVHVGTQVDGALQREAIFKREDKIK